MPRNKHNGFYNFFNRKLVYVFTSEGNHSKKQRSINAPL